MAAYKRRSPLPIIEGGTEKQSFDSNTVICGGTTGTNPLQNVVGEGNIFDVLTSQGAGTLPVWQSLNNATFFERLAADPVVPIVGQVWYNTTTQLFKGAIASGGALVWVVKTPMNTARISLGGAGNDGNDVLSFGGFLSGFTFLSTTERYDGTANTWTAKAGLNTARGFLAGAGSGGDALSVGGSASTSGGGGVVTNITELYDGVGNTWTVKANLGIQLTTAMASATTTTSVLVFGGNAGGASLARTQLYESGPNTWTTKSNLNSGREEGGGANSSSNALASGGRKDGAIAYISTVEIYNLAGNFWITQASMPTVRATHASAGTTTNSLVYGGRNANVGAGSFLASALEYDEVSNMWSSISSLNNSVRQQAGGGTHTDALSFGGISSITGQQTAVTERYMGGGGPTVVVFDTTP